MGKRVGRRWIRTKRKYWRRLGGRRRRGIFRWRWGKRTKKVGKKKYRMRVLFKKVGRRWIRTKRKYWRRLGGRRRRRYSRRRYSRRRYRRRRRGIFRWRWGKR